MKGGRRLYPEAVDVNATGRRIGPGDLLQVEARLPENSVETRTYLEGLESG